MRALGGPPFAVAPGLQQRVGLRQVPGTPVPAAPGPCAWMQGHYSRSGAGLVHVHLCGLGVLWFVRLNDFLLHRGRVFTVCLGGGVGVSPGGNQDRPPHGQLPQPI
jgi:hypothetical protein